MIVREDGGIVDHQHPVSGASSHATAPAPSLLFLFDMDDVLYRYDWRTRMAGMTALTGHDLDELRRRWWNDEGEWRAEAGHWPDGDSYLAALETALGCRVPEQEWSRIRGSAMTPIPRALDAVRTAARAGRVALLTNNGPLAARHIARWAPELPALFGEHLNTSSDFGARKPDPEVFRSALRHHGVPAVRTFFADDRVENVEGARHVGITAVHVTPETDLVAAVAAFVAGHGRSGGPEQQD
ncbi:HAD family phosphatase [Curtobacterium sp. MCBD17_034]|nr:HAD family phosphatase [Curtobacterium sp. MCBD17_028]PZE77220.1 HAD family phosphatase [Curtobacterium sp. MCBD17_019]PZF59098.1 HAD family phosphatase [Curtobacterium sp. MCBD17_034]PZM34359.1 HAD family phosphatase [Curtobacterium sp. MCBD17_031]